MSEIVRDGQRVNVCDSCGADVGNGSVVDAVTIHGMSEEGQPVTLAFGTRCGCVTRRLTRAALRWRQEDPASPGPVTFYRPKE
jgi:hypothetical protein